MPQGPAVFCLTTRQAPALPLAPRGPHPAQVSPQSNAVMRLTLTPCSPWLSFSEGSFLLEPAVCSCLLVCQIEAVLTGLTVPSECGGGWPHRSVGAELCYPGLS